VDRKLGEILIERGACQPRHVHEALQNQVIFGGRLGTNLLELGSVTEEALAEALHLRLGVPAVHGDDLEPEAEALALMGQDVADRCDAVPFALEDHKLVLLTVNPNDLNMLDEVAFATDRSVLALVAPEARVWALLRRHYAIDRQLRGIEVDFQPGTTVRPAAASETHGPSVAMDLMDQAGFDALYAQSALSTREPPHAFERPPAPQAAPPTAGKPPAPQAAPPPAGKPTAPPSAPSLPRRRSMTLPAVGGPPGPPPPPPEEEVLDLTDEIVEPAPTAPPPPHQAPPRPVPRTRATHLALKAVLSTGARPAPKLPPTQILPAVTAPVPPPAAPEAAPLAFADALQALLGVEDRDAIARIVLRHARARFKRAVLFTVRKGTAWGWAGLGEGLTAGSVRRMRLALGQPGVLDTVVGTRAHYLGPLSKTESNVRLLKQLGGGVPRSAILLPVLAQGRVVNVLYADEGRGAQVEPAAVGDLLILATRIAQSWDQLLARVR